MADPMEAVVLFLQASVFVALILTPFWLFPAVADLLRRKRNAMQPVVETMAKLVSKRSETHTRHTRYRSYTYVYYFLAFKPVNGCPAMEFRVSEIAYNNEEYGEIALLRYRGNEFLGFGPGLDDVKPIAPLPEEHNRTEQEKANLLVVLYRKLCDLIWDWAAYPILAWDWLCGLRERRNSSPAADDTQQHGVLTHELDE